MSSPDGCVDYEVAGLESGDTAKRTAFGERSERLPHRKRRLTKPFHRTKHNATLSPMFCVEVARLPSKDGVDDSQVRGYSPSLPDGTKGHARLSLFNKRKIVLDAPALISVNGYFVSRIYGRIRHFTPQHPSTNKAFITDLHQELKLSKSSVILFITKP